MPAADSIDLGQRIINAYQAKEGSPRKLAKRFQVSLAFVKRLIRREPETGDIQPKSHGAKARAKITRADLTQINQLVEEQPEALLPELCERLEQKKGIKVSISTMHRKLEELRFTTKKAARPRVAERRKGTLAKTNSVCERAGKSQSAKKAI